MCNSQVNLWAFSVCWSQSLSVVSSLLLFLNQPYVCAAVEPRPLRIPQSLTCVQREFFSNAGRRMQGAPESLGRSWPFCSWPLLRRRNTRPKKKVPCHSSGYTAYRTRSLTPALVLSCRSSSPEARGRGARSVSGRTVSSAALAWLGQRLRS